MARLTREESQARTRELLIEAARQEVARQGFGGASVGAITEAAGFSKGAFYSNFASKEAILLELLRRHKMQEIADLGALVDASADVATVLGALRRRYATLDRDADWSLLANELQLHAARSPAFAASYEALSRDHRGALAALIAALFRKAGKIPPADAEDLAMAFLALGQGLALQHAASADSARVDGTVIVTMLESLLEAAKPMARAGAERSVTKRRRDGRGD